MVPVRHQAMDPYSPDDQPSPPRKRLRAAGAWDEEPDDEAGTIEKPNAKVSQLRHNPGQKSVEELIGKVRPVRKPEMRRLCAHFLKNDCMWGDQCRFSHSVEDLRADAPATESMQFNNLEASLSSRSVGVPRPQLKFLMTEDIRQGLADVTGVSSVVWDPDKAKVTLAGTPQQVEAAEQLLKRVTTHCSWGINEAKVSGLMRLQPCKAAKVRLSPMHPALKPMTVNLNAINDRLTLGSGSSNDLVLKGPLISRAHATLEFVPGKGALYVIDTSTNGTFVNGLRLPAKSSGKVVLWHGDELLFPEPDMTGSSMEYGYMVNVELIQ